MTTLEDTLLPLGIRDNLITAVNRGMETDPTKPEYHDLFFNNYLATARDYTQAMLENAKKIGSRNIVELRRHIGRFKEQDESALAAGVEAEFQSVVSALSDESKLHTAAMLPGEGKQYVDIYRALETQDINQIRTAYAGAVKGEDKFWIDFIVKESDDRTIMELAPLHVGEMARRFMAKYLSTRRKSGDQVEIIPSPKKAKSYILDTVGTLGDEDKKRAYLEAGRNYTRQIVTAQQAETAATSS